MLSGPYITYISENAKGELRSYAGKAMQVDASDVFQPVNPGDALIRKYKIVGPAPDNHLWATLDGLQLMASSDFGPYGAPTFLLEFRDAGTRVATVNLQQVAPVLLAPVDERIPLLPALLTPIDERSPFLPSDGGSVAVIKRSDLVHHGALQGAVGGIAGSWSFTPDRETNPTERTELNPGQPMKIRITFHVPAGRYQFIFGYGGGVQEEKSLASNAISFNVSDTGFATLAN